MQVNDRLAIPATAKDYLLHSILLRDVYYTRRLTVTELVNRFAQSVVSISLLILNLYYCFLLCLSTFDMLFSQMNEFCSEMLVQSSFLQDAQNFTQQMNNFQVRMVELEKRLR